MGHDTHGQMLRRQRMAPEMRATRLLDAALVEFSANGYTAATVEAIARRAGLSKSGFYAHFPSKEAVFEALLDNQLMPRFGNPWQALENGVPVREVIDGFIDNAYEQLLSPTAITLLKVMIVDNKRVAPLSRRWERSVLDPYLRVQQDVIDRCVARGLLRSNPMTERFTMAISPLVYMAIRAMVLESANSDEVARQRESHRQLLYLLLEP